ncbi:hypothetical protein ACIRQF_36195 [Streptomyces sp. NPDC101191]|uniref:hypothetical protein n=1 Tax=Streptomyces sp. NPDC101191 TaxID=3366126 RepID=UPI003827C420
MLIPDLSTTGWWAFAIVSALALWIAVASMTTTRRHKLASVAVPTVLLVGGYAQSAARGYESKEAAFVITLIALTLVIMRIIFAGWLTRQKKRQEAEEPVDDHVGRQTAVFVGTFVVVLVGVGFLIG